MLELFDGSAYIYGDILLVTYACKVIILVASWLYLTDILTVLVRSLFMKHLRNQIVLEKQISSLFLQGHYA